MTYKKSKNKSLLENFFLKGGGRGIDIMHTAESALAVFLLCFK